MHLALEQAFVSPLNVNVIIAKFVNPPEAKVWRTDCRSCWEDNGPSPHVSSPPTPPTPGLSASSKWGSYRSKLGADSKYHLSALTSA